MKTFLLLALFSSCAHVNPPPTPPQQASCAEACAHLVEATDGGLNCPASYDTCMGLCIPVAANNPAYPACVVNATRCDYDCDTGR